MLGIQLSRRCNPRKFKITSVDIQSRGYAQDFRIKRLMRLPKQKMYDIVGDVSKYHEFVPYCISSEIIQRDKKGVPELATLRVGWNHFDEHFTSQLEYKENQVTAYAADNKMFKELLCEWVLQEMDENNCIVHLKLRFEFQNKFYDVIAQNAGSLVSRKMIEAFTKRAISIS